MADEKEDSTDCDDGFEDFRRSVLNQAEAEYRAAFGEEFMDHGSHVLRILMRWEANHFCHPKDTPEGYSLWPANKRAAYRATVLRRLSNDDLEREFRKLYGKIRESVQGGFSATKALAYLSWLREYRARYGLGQGRVRVGGVTGAALFSAFEPRLLCFEAGAMKVQEPEACRHDPSARTFYAFGYAHAMRGTSQAPNKDMVERSYARCAQALLENLVPISELDSEFSVKLSPPVAPFPGFVQTVLREMKDTPGRGSPEKPVELTSRLIAAMSLLCDVDPDFLRRYWDGETKQKQTVFGAIQRLEQRVTVAKRN